MDATIALIDIDGCLTLNKGTSMPLLELYTLQKSNALVPFALCTGRSQPYVEAIIQMLGSNAFLRPSIVENGCFLYDPCKETLLPHPLIKKGIKNSFRKIRRLLEVHCCEAPIQPGKEICISLTPMGGERVETLFQKVKDLLKSFEEVFIAHSNSAVDITPKGVDKGSGMLFLCEYLGISKETVVAIGDSYNDIPVLSIAGYSSCPSNSKQEVIDLVRRKGGYVAKAPYTGGVIEILQHYHIIP